MATFSWRVCVGIAILTTSAQASAANPQQKPRPEILTNLLDCHSIGDAAQRLACYDKQVGALTSAVDADQVVVLDSDELKKTKKSLFGFTLPRLPFLSDSQDSPDEVEFQTLSTKIASAQAIGGGRWALRLEDGAQWETTEPFTKIVPKKGTSIVIKRGTMGGFMGSISGWPIVRMRRVS